MPGKFLSLLAIVVLFGILSCKKDEIVPADCMELESGLTNSNTGQVKTVITKFINSLPSQDYTENNLNRLVRTIGEQCGVSAAVLCYDCIKTLPSQSEIHLSYAGTTNPAN